MRATPFLLLLGGCLISGDNTRQPDPYIGGDAPFHLQDPVAVTQVIDGDTIEVILNDVVERVRLQGIDTPELYSEPPEAYAAEARQFALSTIGTEVDLEFDSHCPQPPEELCRDDTPGRRLLAYVRIADGADLGALLLQQGLAEVFIYNGEPFDRRDEYLALESEAQQSGVGMWQ